MNTHTSDIDTPVVVIDTTQALKDVGGDRELLSELAVFFAEDAPKICRELVVAAKSETWEKAARYAHSLKNMASQFRAEPTTSLAAKLENLTKIRARDEITPQLIDELAKSIECAISELQAIGLLK